MSSVDWMNDAACRGFDPEMWFRDSKNTSRELATVRAICAACPVRKLCLSTAMAGDFYGIWGGSTRDERIAAQRSRLVVCAWCGVEFKRLGQARFCSDVCRRTGAGRTAQARRPA
jgi:hypothetical protein